MTYSMMTHMLVRMRRMGPRWLCATHLTTQENNMPQRTASAWGFWSNWFYGFTILFDAIVSIGSFGMYSGGAQLTYARWRTKRRFAQLKKDKTC